MEDFQGGKNILLDALMVDTSHGFSKLIEYTISES